MLIPLVPQPVLQSERKKKRQERFQGTNSADASAESAGGNKRPKIEAVTDPEIIRKMEERAKRFAPQQTEA